MRPDGNSAPLRVLVSGGIGSGKSTVLRTLEAEGVVVIEADRIGHQILEPNGAAFRRVTQRWPAVVVDGRIDRGKLAAIVFNDEEELAALESISHPLIAAEIERRVGEAGDRDVAVELPLASDPAGLGWPRIVVVAPERLRLQRAVRRGMTEEDVAARMANQPDESEWALAGDVTLDNSGSVAELAAAAKRVWASLKARQGGAG